MRATMLFHAHYFADVRMLAVRLSWAASSVLRVREFGCRPCQGYRGVAGWELGKRHSGFCHCGAFLERRSRGRIALRYRWMYSSMRSARSLLASHSTKALGLLV